MSDLFAAAAARAERERAKKQKQPEGNALERLLAERRAEKEASEKRAELWQGCINFAINRTEELCYALGSPVLGARYDGTFIWIVRKGEAIRLPVGAIRDNADLAAACVKMIGSVCRC